MEPRDERLVKLAEKGANDADIMLLDLVHNLEDKIDKTTKTVDEKIAELEEGMPDLEKVLESVRGKKGEVGSQGEPGLTPTPEELITLIQPLIPEPIKGEPGESITGPMGPKPIAGLDYPIPENGKDGESIKGDKGDDGSPDSPEQVRDKLEILQGDERLDVSAIKGIDDKIAILEKRISSIKIPQMGMKKIQYVKRVNLTSQVDGIVTSFTLPKDTVAVISVASTQFPMTFDAADFTLTGNRLVLSSSLGTIQAGQTLVALVETLFYG